jgi:hypothetical protein
VALWGFDRRFPDEKGRLELRDSAGTRNAQTELDAACPRLDGRKACVRALRKHVCTVLIEGQPARMVRVNACAWGVGCNFFHDDDDSRSKRPP